MFKNNNKNNEKNVKTRHLLPRLNDQETATILGDKIPDVQKWPRSRFKRIESEHRPLNNSRVERLLDILKKAQRFELSQDEKKLATFFVADNKEQDVYGGAVLLRKKVLNAHKSRESRYAFQGEHLWTCALGLSLTNKDPLHMSGERVAFIRGLYQELYAVLVAFGAEREAAFLWVTLDSLDALLLDKFGDFPFILQIKPENAVDGLFHGLLALRDDLALPFLKTRYWGENLGDKRVLRRSPLNELSLNASSLKVGSQQEEEMR